MGIVCCHRGPGKVGDGDDVQRGRLGLNTINPY